MKKSINILTAFLLAAGSLSAAVTGCELVAAVDKAKLGSGGMGGSPSSSSSSSASASSSSGMLVCDAGAMMCPMGVGDCNAQTTKCILNTCGGGCCGTALAASGASCTDNGGNVCDGNGLCIECLKDSDCPMSPTVCAAPKCDTTMNKCGATNAPKGMACEGTGNVCDGNGACTAMHCTDTLLDSDETDVDCGGSCAMGATPKKCATGKMCKNGSDCADKLCGGQQGACTTGCTCDAPKCTDGVQNGDETDQDCGGSCAPTKVCDNGKGCGMGTDCLSANCQAKLCVGKPLGSTCKVGGECIAPGDCVIAPGDTNGICCSTTCSDQGAASCDNTGACNANGMGCAKYASGTQCLAPVCSNGQLTTASTCDGAGNCSAGTMAACPHAVKCASGTACKGACGADTDCQSSGDFCSSGNCIPKLTDGAVCSGGTQCQHNICFGSPTNHCCQMGGCTTGGTCGATDCASGTGACVYPTSSTPCGTASCSGTTFTPAGTCNGNGSCTQTPSQCTDQGAASCGTNGTCNGAGTACAKYPSTTVCVAASCNTSTNVFTAASMCNGTGTCVAGAVGACNGHLTCNGTTACNTACGTNDATGDMKCVSNFWCDGMSGGACQAKQSTGGACNRDSQCTATCCLIAGTPAACTSVLLGTCL